MGPRVDARAGLGAAARRVRHRAARPRDGSDRDARRDEPVPREDMGVVAEV